MAKVLLHVQSEFFATAAVQNEESAALIGVFNMPGVTLQPSGGYFAIEDHDGVSALQWTGDATAPAGIYEMQATHPSSAPLTMRICVFANTAPPPVTQPHEAAPIHFIPAEESE